MTCLDTSILIDIIKGKTEMIPLETRLDNSLESTTIAAPVLTELTAGLYLSDDPTKEKERMNKIISMFSILSLDKESAILAGNIKAELAQKGESIDVIDIMIGAIAKQNNEVLITKNIKHFERIPGLKIETY